MQAEEMSSNQYPTTPSDLLVIKDSCFCPWCKGNEAYFESWVEHAHTGEKRFVSMFTCNKCKEEKAFCYGVNK